MSLVLADFLPLAGSKAQSFPRRLGFMEFDLKLAVQVKPTTLRNLQRKPAIDLAAKRGL
ncbi:hypothetical protein [Mesorhizobium sp. M6A.T.Ce.TU.016.01.1.1]|uniref:hypothetical protein n=1 Tax=Mesorhizobium sp. M6A.T.Ce.TU.016.01.1.1 TaxID=2496783 RepID=UPI00163C27BE|nr:hypothetical protein [Mesorhizobium sp. M6A.T.Ce.TU.016.01.1.1]